MAKVLLDEIETHFKNKGYIMPKQRQNIYEKVIRIYKSNWNNNDFDGFWFNIFFDLGLDLELETESESPPIVLSVQFCCRKKFFENVKSKFKIDVKKGIQRLEEKGFQEMDEKDPVVFRGLSVLKEITKNYTLDKNQQIKAIIDYLEEDVVNYLEGSDLIKLLEKNYPQLA